MTTKSVRTKQSNFIFGVNSIVEFKYKNKQWKIGVIISSSRADGMIIDLEISEEKYEQIHLYHSKAMTYYLIQKTLKPSKIQIPKQLFSIGTNIEYKYKNKDWKNGRIIDINPNNFNQTTLKIQKTVYKSKTIKISRTTLILNYAFKKTLKLSNIIYPFWISFDSKVKVREISEYGKNGIIAKTILEYYNIACYRDGKYITLYKTCEKDVLMIKQSKITSISNMSITTKTHEIVQDSETPNCIMDKTIYNWKIQSLSVNKRKDLFCNGFIRRTYNGYIPSVMVQLIAYFVSDIMEDIKSAEFKQPFYTLPVVIKGFEWYVEFYPCGLSSSYVGCFEVFLCLRSMPKKVFGLDVDWKLHLKEVDSFEYTPYHWWHQGGYKQDWFRVNEVFWRRTGDRDRRQSQRLRLKLEKIKNLNTLTFVFEIKYNSVVDKYNNPDIFDRYYRKPMYE
eukprot:471766_1